MLMTAALSGKADAVRLLLTRGAKVDAKEPYQGTDRADVGRGRRQHRRRRRAARSGRRPQAEVDRRLHAAAVRRPQRAPRHRGHAAEARRQRQRRGARRLERARAWPPSTPTSSWRRCCSITAPIRTCPIRAASPLHTVAWLRKPGADGAAGVGNTPQGTPQQTGKVTALQLAKKLLEHGANPNTRVEWKEPRFGKEGGTARNPPNIRLGRHLLSYIGATPFYVAAKNGDAPLMRLLAESRRRPEDRRRRPASRR